MTAGNTKEVYIVGAKPSLDLLSISITNTVLELSLHDLFESIYEQFILVS